MMFNWADFLNKDSKIAVHCKTREEAEDFCQHLLNLGKTWRNGNSYKNSMWEIYQEETCYSGQGGYSHIGFYEESDYIILEWSAYMENNFKKADLKTGMIVTTREGNEYMVCLGTASGDILVNIKNHTWFGLNVFTENLIATNFPECDIIKVETVPVFNIANMEATRHFLWKREEIKEVTMAEVEAKFGCKVKIVKTK